MAVKPIGTTALTWGSLLGRGNREPIDATQLNYSYTDLLWELNQRTVSYKIGTNNGGSGNYYVGLITSVPYVNEDDKRKDSNYTKDDEGNKVLETIDMKGPWYVSYKGTDKGRGTAKNKYGFVPDGNPNTYYADRIVLKQEMDYTLDKDFVRKTQLGTYYTGVGHWYDSYTKSKEYSYEKKELPDGTYFPTTSYAEIFNDYTYNVATGNFSHAEGKLTKVNGEASHVEGYSNTVNALHAHAEGHRNTVSGNDSHAEGRENIVSGEYAHVEGYKNKVLFNAGHAEGTTTTVSAVNAHTEGNSTYVHSNADNSHAEGTGSYTKGVNAHAENSSYANGKNSHSGGEATAGGINSFAHGIKGTLASGVNSVALVSGTASGDNSVAVKGTASGSNSIAFTGTASGDNSISLDGTASGSNSVSIQGTAKSTDSVAIGQGSVAETGQGAMALIKGHATGQQSLATNASTASGENSISTNISTATGVNSAALNNGTASGEGSVAMNYSKATGKGSVAIGLGTVAKGEYSLAQGHESKANNHDSHAEGYGTNASRDQSHTEGIVTTTNGLASHAEGQGSITGTNATAAHAEGSYTIANNESEHAQGKYNVSDPKNTDTGNSGTLFTIGNGTADDKRHNVVGIYHNGDINIEGPNTTNHNTGYFKTTVDGNHTEVVKGNYTQTIGTATKNNTCNITVNGNTTNRFNGTSDTRTTGAAYEGYGSTFISTVSGFKSCYAYDGNYVYVNKALETFVNGSITERSDNSVYLSAPKICIHGDATKDGTYIDISSDVSYVYGRRHTYIGQPVHDGTSATTTIKGTTINENSTTSNKTTNTNNENVTGNSTIKVTGNTNLNTGSLNITSGSTNLDLNKTHIHVTNELCIKSSTDAYFKGAKNTFIGKDQEGNKGTNFYVTSTTKGDLTSPSISLNASTKYDENIGNKFVIATGTLTEDITGAVTKINKDNYTSYTYENSYIYVHGNITNTTEGNREIATVGNVNITNGTIVKNDKKQDVEQQSEVKIITYGTSYAYTSSNKDDIVKGIRTNITVGNVNITNGTIVKNDKKQDVEQQSEVKIITYGTSYAYTSSNKDDIVKGIRTNITANNVNVTNEANVNITTGGVHTESITNERSVTVGKHDSLIVSSGGKTEKITGEKITQVVSGNINAYTDDTHDTRLNTRSAYIETVHVYIGDKTNTVINGNYSIGLGQGIKVSSHTNTTVGKYNEDKKSYFAVGIGVGPYKDDEGKPQISRKNAFWISQGNTAGTNGVGYFSNNTYVYGNTYDPGQYPNNKEDKSWSAVVTYNMYRNSYTYLYNTMNDKFDTFGTGTYFTKSIDPFTYTPVSYTLHYTTQVFKQTYIDNNVEKHNVWLNNTYTLVLPQAIPGALENDNSGIAGLMSARDKARLDSIWEGDKQIAGIQISTGSWQVFKNDGITSYKLANIVHKSNNITNLQIEYGFRPKWSGTWKWTVDNQKEPERCDGAWDKKLPAVNTNSDVWSSPILNGGGGEVCYQTIFAKKRGLIISGYPDDYAASSDGTKHLGSIVPASGEDNTSCFVNWSTYRLLFYGICTMQELNEALYNNLGNLKDKKESVVKIDENNHLGRHSKAIYSKNWNIDYLSDSNHCFFMAFPTNWGKISQIKKNGVEIITSSFIQVTIEKNGVKTETFKYINGAGLPQQYYIYRSNVGSANMSITIS